MAGRRNNSGVGAGRPWLAPGQGGRGRHETGGGARGWARRRRLAPGWVRRRRFALGAGALVAMVAVVAAGLGLAGPGPRRALPALARVADVHRHSDSDLTAAQLLDRARPIPAGWHATVHAVAVDGLDRPYLVVEPDHLTGRVPVVVALHGRDMTPDGMLALSDLPPSLSPTVIVYPEGYKRSWNAGNCCGHAQRAAIDDVGYIRAVLRAVLASTPAADPSAVYAVGFSNGGRMAYRLACELPGTFAGIAAVEAVPVSPCGGLHPLNIEIIAQSADPLLSIAGRQMHVGGKVEPTVQQVVERWRALDGCAGPPVVATYRHAATTTWSCRAGTRLEYALYQGGGHRWRRARGAAPGATELIQGFFGLTARAPAE